MPGFLLADDAIEARKNVFDEWLADRQRDAQQAAQAAQDAAQRAQQAVQERQAQAAQVAAAAAQSIQAAQAPPEPITPEAQQRAAAFDEWLRRPTTPEAQARADLFENWENYTAAEQGVRDWLRRSADQTGDAVGGAEGTRDGSLQDGFMAPVARGVQEAVSGLQSPQTGNPLLDVVGTGASALGTGAQALATGVRNITPTSELARGALGMEQLVTDNRDLFDQQQRLVDEFIGAQARDDQAAMDDIRGRMDALQAQLPDARNRDVLHAAAERNPSTPLVETGANVAGAGFAAPLAAEGAPLAARALAAAIDPATGLPAVAGRALEAAGGRVPGAVRDFLSGEESEAGGVAPMVGARLGSAVAGGLAGNATTPEDADPLARAAHIGGGALAGLVAPGVAMAAIRDTPPSLSQIAAMRPRGPMAGPIVPRSGLENAITYTTENLLSGPTTHLMNIASQLYELLRQPVVAAVSGREDEAVAGLRAAAQALPEAAQAFGSVLRTGRATSGAPRETSVLNPFLRILGATDDFFRTVGQDMGRGMEARRVLSENGNPASLPQIQTLMQGNADRILNAGDRAGRLSVFGEGATSGLGQWLSDTRQTLLTSPSAYHRAAGMLMNAVVPFSNVPERVWTIGVARSPGFNELGSLIRAGAAGARGDGAAVRQTLAEGAVNSVINTAILSQVLNGNVTGPDDPEHPSSVRIGGTWYSYSGWGPFALQFGIPAAIMESVRKTGNTPDQETLDYATKALTASAKTIIDTNYLSGALDLAGALSSSDPGRGIGRFATSYVDRYIPKSGLLNAFEQSFDEHMREVSQGKPWERQMSRIPGLAGLLPTKVSPTTGEPLMRTRAGPAGVLLRADTQESDPLRGELSRLDRLGYTMPDLKVYPDTVSWHGTEIKLRPEEQRAITATLGKARADLAAEITSPTWDRNTDDAKALFLNKRLDRIDQLKTAAWLDKVDPADAERRLNEAERVAGRLVNRSPGPLPEVAAALGGGQASAAGRPAPAPAEQLAAARPGAPAPAAADDRFAQMRAYLDSILGQSSGALLQRLTAQQRDELAATLVEEERRAQQQRRAQQAAASR